MAASASFSALRLSGTGTSPHLRMMVNGARMLHTGRAVQVQKSQPVRAATLGKATSSYIQGTVNDPTTFPAPSAAHGSYHWAFERTLSIALLPLVAAATVKHGTSGILDATLALSLVVHSHIGFDSILTDYLHKRKFPTVGPIAVWTLRAATLGAIVGLYEFNTNDVGLSELVARLWVA